MKKKVVKRSNSALNVKYPKIPSTIKYALTPEQIYQLDINQLEYGIEGYEVPRQYYDYHQVMWHKKREKILTAHRHIFHLTTGLVIKKMIKLELNQNV